MATLITAFYPHILAELPKAPKVLVREYIRQTCISFCEETLINRQIQTPYVTVANQRDYNFTQPTNELVYKVMSAELAGVPIDYETPEALDIHYPGWRKPTNVLQVGAPAAVTQLNATSFMLVPTPTVSAQEIVLDVACKPTNTADSVADILFNEYYQEIAWGVKAQLMIMSDKPWTNAAQGVAYGKMFADAIIQTSNRQQEGFGRPRIRTRAQFL